MRLALRSEAMQSRGKELQKLDAVPVRLKKNKKILSATCCNLRNESDRTVHGVSNAVAVGTQTAEDLHPSAHPTLHAFKNS